MTQGEKTAFIHSLCDSVRNTAIARIHHMPEGWDGIELREYLARLFDHECLMSRDPRLHRRRLRDFKNAIATMYGL